MNRTPASSLMPDEDVQNRLLEINQALLISSLTQHELTEKAQMAERALRTSEEKYRTLFTSIEEGFCILEKVQGTPDEPADFRYLEANPAFAVHSGVSDVVGKTIREVLLDGSEDWIDTYETILSTGKPTRFERTFMSQDRLLELYAFRIEIEPSRRVAVVFKNITARKEAEETLRLSLERFQFILEMVPDKIASAGADGQYDYFNTNWTAYTGLSVEQLRDGGWMQIIHPDDLPASSSAWKASIETGEPFVREHRFRRHDGQFRWHLTHAMAMRDQSGKVVKWFSSNTEIHGIREMNMELERRVMERTAELLSANELLQGFTHSVAHDIRQQIRGISTNGSILAIDAGDSLEGAHRDTLKRMIDNAKRLSLLVDDLLHHARLTRMEPNPQPLDISALATGAAAVLLDTGACKPGTSHRIEPGLTAYGDASMIRLVLENLLDNASKYASVTDVPVIEVGQLGEEFFVRDNGIGFDMRYAHKLFQPLERLHGESYVGTGIGLANVKRIVEKHGGTVRAEGETSKGATFYFTLPKG